MLPAQASTSYESFSPSVNRKNDLRRKYSQRTSRNLSRLNSDVELARASRNQQTGTTERIPSRYSKSMGRSGSLNSMGRYSPYLNRLRDSAFASQPCNLTRNECENSVACTDLSKSNFLADLKRNHEAYHMKTRFFMTQPKIRSKMCEKCGGIMPLSQSFCNTGRRSMIQ